MKLRVRGLMLLTLALGTHTEITDAGLRELARSPNLARTVTASGPLNGDDVLDGVRLTRPDVRFLPGDD